MKRAALLLIMTFITASIVGATSDTNSFSITNNEGVTITTPTAFDSITFFVDGTLITTIDNIAANKQTTFNVDEGNHSIEVRALKTYSYQWENFVVKENDAPISLTYLRYDREKKRILFSLDGADIIHPDRMATTARSLKDNYDEYQVIMNGDQELFCYPYLTTGEPLFFSCSTVGAYPETIQITATLGIREQATINIIGSTQTTNNKPTTNTVTSEQAAVSRTSGEETVIDDIEMNDTIPQQDTPVPIMVFIILIFLAFITILFIASHHNYESKRTGTHHQVKRKQKQKEY